MKKLTVVLLLAALCSSCGDDELNLSCELTDLQTELEIDCDLSRDLSYTRKQIKGTWTWVQRPVFQRGQPFYYATPKRIGHAMSIFFDGDEAHWYQCDSLIKTNKFKIVKYIDVSGPGIASEYSDFTSIAFYELETGKLLENIPTQICKDYLKIEYGYLYPDATSDVYIKN
jgi:hypothetical protein